MIHAEDRPCLGHQGTCHVIVGLCQQDLGTQGLGAVAILGGTLVDWSR